MNKKSSASIFKTVSLPCAISNVVNVENHLLNRTKGKSVLYVGAAGNMFHYLPLNPSQFLFPRLQSVSRELTAIDIDQDAIDYAANHGLLIHKADCQNMDLGKKFESILLLDVIEHLEYPGNALDCLMSHLEPDGELIVTTPNASYFGWFIKALFRRSPEIYWDHVSCYLPENIQVLCQRHNCQLTEVKFFTQMNKWSKWVFIKSLVILCVCALVPRWNNAFMAVIRH